MVLISAGKGWSQRFRSVDGSLVLLAAILAATLPSLRVPTVAIIGCKDSRGLRGS
jgi:hypothetical protein